jgi:hypothetical protein
MLEQHFGLTKPTWKQDAEATAERATADLAAR